MSDQPGVQVARAMFEMERGFLLDAARALVDDPDAAVADAAERLDAMIPELAYLDRPEQPMAAPLFQCATALALYLALRERGVAVHDFGAEFLTQLRAFAELLPESPIEYDETMVRLAEESQRSAQPGEFVFEILPIDDTGAWGINMLSCAICHHFSKYDAMELVPYMCASDDVLSDQFDQGLRRTGTIALGAHHCDFRYHTGAEPLRVADQYPEPIRIRSSRERAATGTEER
jgi:hypothetical protein